MATEFEYTRRTRAERGDDRRDPLTVAWIKSLARECWQYGRTVIEPRESTIPCPLDVSTHGMAHRITVHHKPYATPTARQVLTAVHEHLTDPYDDTRCRWVTRRGQ